MGTQDPNLIVRSNRRRSIGLDADFVIAPQHAGGVRFSAGVQLRDEGVPVTAVDMSEGGVGALSTTYLPKRCLGRIRFRDPRGGETPLFEATARVARTTMVDRRPGYQVGLLFEDASEDFASRLKAFLSLVDDVG